MKIKKSAHRRLFCLAISFVAGMSLPMVIDKNMVNGEGILKKCFLLKAAKLLRDSLAKPLRDSRFK